MFERICLIIISWSSDNMQHLMIINIFYKYINLKYMYKTLLAFMSKKVLKLHFILNILKNLKIFTLLTQNIYVFEKKCECTFWRKTFSCQRFSIGDAASSQRLTVYPTITGILEAWNLSLNSGLSQDLCVFLTIISRQRTYSEFRGCLRKTPKVFSLLNVE